MRLKAAGIVASLLIAAALVYSWNAGHFTRDTHRQVEPRAQTQMAGHQHGGTVPAEEPSETQPQRASEEVPTIEIPPEKQQLIGVRTVRASVQPLHKVIRTVGVVEYDQTRVTTINTKVEGWVEKLYVGFTGAYVKKGQRLADLYSPDLWATQQEFINVIRFAKMAKAKSPSATTPAVPGAPDYSTMLGRDLDVLLDAARQRLRLWDISDDQIRAIEGSERPMTTLAIYSPVSGYVLGKPAVQGMKVMPGEKLFDVADLSTLWISADVYEYELPLIKVGDPALVQLSYFPGREFRSRIDYIYPTLTGETRTAKVRFSIPNHGGLLKPQMFTNVAFKIDLGRRLAVSEDAVIDTGVRQIVYVDRGEGYFEPREVATGIRADRFVEITAGLTAGEKVASSANFLIDSEAKLKGVDPLPRQKPAQEQGQGSRNKVQYHTDQGAKRQ